MSDQRITFIVRDPRKPSIDWNPVRSRNAHVAFLDSIDAVIPALDAAVDIALDVERLIVDRAATAEEFLGLLATLPFELTGDVIFIREDGSGFLSATGRGGDRLLYALGANDIRFYLETFDLVSSRVSLAVSA